MVEFEVLGPLKAIKGEHLLALGGPKQRLVLALLLADPGQTISVDRLIDGVWDGQPPDTARKTLQGYVHHLREVVGSVIQTDQAGYRLDTAGVSIDAIEFEAAFETVASSKDPDPQWASETLATALGMWSGAPYAGLDGTLALEPEIARLNEMRLAALEYRIEADIELGGSTQLIGELESLTLEYPLRERFHGLLMRALYVAGRQAEALRSFERVRMFLADEVGLDVSPALRRLQDQILNQDPALDPLPGEAAMRLPNAVRGYELREVVAEGPQGRVHRGFHTAIGREVAVKVIDGELANEADFIAGFSNETLAVSQLVHPHIVQIVDFWREPGRAFVVSPWLGGGTLAERAQEIDDGALAPSELEQVADALGFAHRRGLVHGRIADTQVLFDGDGNAYLAGFEVGPGGNDGDQFFTAPEVAAGGRPTTHSDIYALARVVARHFAVPSSSSRAVQDVIETATATRPEDRFQRLEDFLRAFRRALGTDVTAMAGSPGRERADVRNPYKGLRAFLESDVQDFYGRDDLVDSLLTVLDSRRFVAVVGPSGSGKSSVVRAGLVPALRKRAVDRDRTLLISEMYPGSYPFEELAAALLRVAVEQPPGVVADLAADGRGLLRVTKQVLPNDDSEMVLIIDQFEELFSMVGDESTRNLFLENLVTAVSDERSRISIVMTLRADFFDRPMEYPEFAELVEAGLVMVTPLTRDGISRAVSGPAQSVGIDLEPGLTTQIAADVEGQPGGLPLMQYALTEMFEAREAMELTLDGYHAIGGVSGALGVRAENVFQSLRPAGKEAMRQCFLRLVSIDENADDVRRRVRRGELTSLAVDQRALEEGIRAFGASRLLSFDRDPHTRGPTVEVAHEALLREWPRLRSWIDAQRGDLIHHRAFAIEVDEWQLAGGDRSYLLRGGRLEQFEAWAEDTSISLTVPESEFLEESRVQRAQEQATARKADARLRTMLIGVSLLAVVAVVAGVIAASQASRASSEAEEALAAEASAETRRLVAEAPLFVDTNRQLAFLLAAEAFRRDPGPTTLGALQQVLARTEGFLGYVGVGAPVYGIAFTSTGDVVALNDDAVRVYRPGEDTPRREVPLAGGTILRTRGDHAAIAAGSTVSLLDLADSTAAVTTLVGPSTEVVSLAFNEDGSQLVGGDVAGDAFIWSAESGALLLTLPETHGEREAEGIELPPHQPDRAQFGVRAIAISSDNSRIATGGLATVRLWDTATGEQIDEIALDRRSPGEPRVPAPIRSLAFEPGHNDSLVIASSFNAVLYEVGSGAIDLATEREFPNRIEAVATQTVDTEIQVVGDTVFMSQVGGRLVGLPLDGRPPVVYNAQLSGEPSVAVAPDGVSVAVGGAEGVAMFSLEGRPLLARVLPRDGHSELSFESDGSVVVLTSPNRLPIALFDLTGEESVAIGVPALPISHFGWLGFNGSLLTWEFDGATATLRPLHDLESPGITFGPTDVMGVTASADGELIATSGAASRDRAFVSVYETATGDTVARLAELDPRNTESDRAIQSLSFSPDGASLIAATNDGAAIVWDTATWEVRAVASQGGGQIALAEYSPDGKWLVTISADGKILLRDPETMQPAFSEILGVTNGVTGLSHGPFFSADGRFMVTTADGVGRLWDLEALIQIGEGFPSDPGTSPAASLDGRWLGTFEGERVLIWDLDVSRWYDIACAAAGRNLTLGEWEQFGPAGRPYEVTCPMWPGAELEEREE